MGAAELGLVAEILAEQLAHAGIVFDDGQGNGKNGGGSKHNGAKVRPNRASPAGWAVPYLGYVPDAGTAWGPAEFCASSTTTLCPMQTSTLSAFFLWLLAALLLLGGRAAWAQAPTFSPASGPAGTSVTITGSGFSGATSVRFGELAARFTVNSSTQLTAIVPRAASTQPISVTTPGGYVLSATAFVPTRVSTNAAFSLVASNFGGVSGSANAAPAVGDLDNDQLLDLLVGRADGTVSRYEQTALNASTFTSLGSLSTSAGTINVGSQATVALVDLDGDGRFSVLLGKSNGTVDEYEQASVGAAQFALVLTNVGNISTGGNSAPNATDFDGNGQLDIIAGKNDGIISQSEQNQPNTDSFYRIDTNFSGIQLSSNTAPFCVDLDGNGRLDMLVGVGSGGLYHYEQTTAGANQVRLITSSFNNILAGSNAKPCVTDIDGDGRLDLLVGRGDGTIDRYEQVENIVINNIAPPSGPVGQAVTITGTGLGTLTSVQFGEVPARFSVVSSTQVDDDGAAPGFDLPTARGQCGAAGAVGHQIQCDAPQLRRSLCPGHG